MFSNDFNEKIQTLRKDIGQLGLSYLPLCRVIDQRAVFCKTGAVAAAIPAALCAVPFQRAAHVGAAGTGGAQKIHGGFCRIDGQLGC